MPDNDFLAWGPVSLSSQPPRWLSPVSAGRHSGRALLEDHCAASRIIDQNASSTGPAASMEAAFQTFSTSGRQWFLSSCCPAGPKLCLPPRGTIFFSGCRGVRGREADIGYGEGELRKQNPESAAFLWPPGLLLLRGHQ